MYIYFQLFIEKWMKTYEEDRSTRLLIEETKKFKILGREAERKLFEEYNLTSSIRRKQEIKVAVVQSYLRFVLAVAKSYKKSTGLPINDFYAEGKLGMLEAFEKFDYTVGIKFGSFAAYEVRRHMDMLVNESDMVRVPVRLRKLVLDAKKKGKPVEQINYGVLADNAISETASISAPVNCDDGDRRTIEDTLAAEDATDYAHALDTVSDGLKSVMEDNLTAEENNLLRRLYGLDGCEDSVSEISSERRVSKEYIRRIRSKALAKLRGLKEISELRNACGE
jgi:RNA polymerase primary sigma factor